MGWITAIFAGFGPSIAACIGLFVAEYMAGARGTDWWRNIEAWLVQRVVAIGGLWMVPLWWHGWSLVDGGAVPLWIGFPIFFATRDFGEFIFHVAQHRIPALWAMHSLHHSDRDMTALTTQRHYWGDQFLKQLTIWPATFLVISPSPALFFCFGITSMWNFAVHARLELNFGRWCWMLNCPAYHRRHHSANPAHYNSNFAALLPIWDVLWGSYRRPDGFPPTGLANAPQNVVEVAIWPLIWNRARLPWRRRMAAPK